MCTRRTFLYVIAVAPLVRLRLVGEHVETLLTAHVAGYRFHEGPRIERLLREGDGLVLRREPHNPHDPRAIAVHHPGGPRIGYVPRRSNEAAAKLMDRGVALRAFVRKIAPDSPPWKRVLVVVTRDKGVLSEKFELDALMQMKDVSEIRRC